MTTTPGRAPFDGDSRTSWRGWSSEGCPAGWTFTDAGEWVKDGEVEDLISRCEFDDFIWEVEWRIGPGGNSGLFYRLTRDYDRPYFSAPEYQLLDDASDARCTPTTSTAAVYDLYAPIADLRKPQGEWNATRIVARGPHIEHWLNGRQVVSYELGSADWTHRVAASKFARYSRYGLAGRGAVGIQGDHGGALALRHIRIRDLAR